MTAFIIKSGICMVLFFGLYWFFLRKEKLLTFNRYYLIFSVLFSIAVPFISFPINIGYDKARGDIITILNNLPEPIQNNNVLSDKETVLSGNIVSASPVQSAVAKTRTIDTRGILIFIYLSGLTLMLVRFCRNIILVNQMFRRSEKIDHDWYKIALLDHPVNPHSFLHTVFLNKQDYLENRLGSNVLRHELEHVKQSHSRDIIFFEMLHIIFWFNPVLFLYKRAAKINHEYLADEAVISNFSDIKTYANELINFISRRASVPFTSGFSPSMIRLRLLMLNTNTSRSGKYIRMLVTVFTSALLMSFFSIRPTNNDAQNRKTKKEANKDIVIEEVYFRGTDFKPQKALVVMDGRKLGTDEKLIVDIRQIKTIVIFKDRKAIRKYGRNAKNGAVEITTYENDKKSAPDSLKFKPIYTINDTVPKGKIDIDVSNLYSLSLWTYPIFPYQDLEKRWQTVAIMTRDYYQIRGKVIQENGEPLPGTLITVTDNPTRVITDKDGRFFMQDVRPGSVGELSAEGYDPLNFKIKSRVFTSDLTIKLDKKNEPDQNFIPTHRKIKDFSGNWKYTEEHGKFSFVYQIHQYDSDSINLKRTIIADGKEHTGNSNFAFNTLEKDKMVTEDNLKAEHLCSIDDEQSFSVTTLIRSRIGLFKEQKSTQTFSLSDDENQMIIRQYYSTEGVSASEQLFKQVFVRITN